MPNNEAAQNCLDLGYTAVLRIGGEFAHHETRTCSKQNLSLISTVRCSPCFNLTYREYNEEDVLDDPLPAY